ncbi:MAG: response regulator [Candidatus Omnitrophota bacterium]
MRTKILIVDDEPDVCNAISSYFGKRGYDVIAAASAKVAMIEFLVERPALILMDIRMPETDGLECLRMIRRVDFEVPIIMLTALTDEDTAKRALESGATDYITKPLSLAAIETAITLYLFLHSVKQ